MPNSIYSAGAMQQEKNDCTILEYAIQNNDASLLAKLFKSTQIPLYLICCAIKYESSISNPEITEILAVQKEKFELAEKICMENRSLKALKKSGFLDFEGVMLDPIVNRRGELLDKMGNVLS